MNHAPKDWETAESMLGVNALLSGPDLETDAPGPWVEAGFQSECAHGDWIDEGDTVRATGDGEWEHRKCVEYDARIKREGQMW